jgi:hypothetical protein
MKTSKAIPWKRKFLECKTIKHEEKIIPLKQMLSKEDEKEDSK